MRDIKFRYIINIDNELKSFYFNLNQVQIGMVNEIPFKSSFIILSRDIYIGLKDKNRKEIYEGDIVYVDTIYNKVHIEYYGKVVFETGAFIIGCDKMADSYMTFIESKNNYDVEVIGNIHEATPEQLKEWGLD